MTREPMTGARTSGVVFVVGCFVVAALVLIDPDLGVWGARLVAPGTLALVHLGAVLAGRVWALVAAVLVSLAGVGAALVAAQLFFVVIFTGKRELMNVPLIDAAYCLVVAVHLVVRVVASRRAERSSADAGD